jgi:hypothetical protein
VKVLRLWLLVVLAVLLPIRGAMAAAMLCPPAGTSVPAELRASEHEAHHGHEQAGGHPMHHQEAAAHHDASPAPDHDQCNLCSAFCSLTPLPSAMPGVPPPLEVSAASFPDFAAPAPSFVCGGQERPPRSI